MQDLALILRLHDAHAWQAAVDHLLLDAAENLRKCSPKLLLGERTQLRSIPVEEPFASVESCSAFSRILPYLNNNADLAP